MATEQLLQASHEHYGSIQVLHQNGQENPGNDTSLKGTGKENLGFRNVWTRLWSVIVSLGTLSVISIFIWAYCHDSLFPLESPDIHPLNDITCSASVSRSDMYRFNELVNEKKYDVLYVTLLTSQNASRNNNTYIYQPNKWLWTRGDSPILDLPSSYPLWSFGILDLHTKRDVFFHLELSPPSCKFEWGSEDTAVAVGKSLVKFSESLKEKNYWCYSVRLRNVQRNPVLEFDFSFFVQDIGYKCCHSHHQNDSSEMVPICVDKVIVNRVWSHIPFVFGLLILCIYPNIMVFLYQYCSFKSFVYWIHHRHESDEKSHDYASTSDKWIFTDFKCPISFLSFVRNIPKCLNKCCCCYCEERKKSKGSRKSEDQKRSKACIRIIKSLSTSIGFVVLSLSIIGLSVVMYLIDHRSHRILQEQIDNGIPVGFLSIMFPYRKNYQNFMAFMNGPQNFIIAHSVIGFIYIFLFEYSKPENKNKDFKMGRFTLNLDLVEKYGRIKISRHYRYGTFETIHANARAVFRGSFWIELSKRLCPLQCKGVAKYFEVFLVFFALTFSFLVHCIPFLFACILIFTNFIYRTHCNKRNYLIHFFLVPIISFGHLYLVFSFTIIFFGSAEFICFIVSFSVLTIVIFPGIAAGIFVFVLVGSYYILSRFRKVARKYASFRDVIISISQELKDKCKGAGARVSKDEEMLNISGIDIDNFEYIVIGPVPNQMDKLNDDGMHCHAKGAVLEVFGPVIPDKLKSISICGLVIQINLETNGDENEKCVLRVDKKNEELQLVPDDAEIAFKPDNCFVTYRNGLPGIPRALMDRAVDEYMPVSGERIQALFWAVVVASVITWVSLIIVHFNKLEQINTIINALMLVVLVKLSDVMKMFSVDVDETQTAKILRGDLRLTVLEYWTEKRYKTKETEQSKDAKNGDIQQEVGV